MRDNGDILLFYGGKFSNFHKTDFIYNDNMFHNSESAFMYAKAKLFKDNEIADKILGGNQFPAKSKVLGRLVRGYCDVTWSDVRYDIMVNILLEKFTQDETCKQVLIDTDNLHIAEASKTDKIWGIGLGLYDDRAFDRSLWKGRNLLGESLMEVRSKIKY